MSIQDSDAEAAAVAVAPRVSLAEIEASIAYKYELTGARAAKASADEPYLSVEADEPTVAALSVLSICILVMRNGFMVIGKSAPASVENFNAELGRKLAYEDAIRQLWPLMGFALRDRLSREKTVTWTAPPDTPPPSPLWPPPPL